uniref:WD_REPEATS_REGION domain-containing protein n=1 Tax=Syphacia muris TaxID=451379 RepID=A0A0N5AKB6_9BILA
MTVTVDTDLTFVGSVFIIVSGIAAFLIAFFVWTRWDQPKKSRKQNSHEVSEEESQPKVVEKPNPFRKSSKQTKWKAEKTREVAYSHPWLLTTLKGHVGQILDIDFSPNGKFLISVCKDRTMFLWHTKDFYEREHKFVRGNIDLDNASRVAFGPDSKSVLLSLQMNNKLSVYKIVKKEETSHGYRLLPVENVDFAEEHDRDINGVGFACNGA